MLSHDTGRMIFNILSIAGTDPTGGAGIQADLKTFSALGAYGMSVITAVVAQNTQGVRSFVSLEPEFVSAQIDAVFEDVRVDAVKIGMVATAAIANTIADRLKHHNAHNVVLDPVMVAKSGDRLLQTDAIAAIRESLAPLATVITPNLPEAAVLLGEDVTWSLAGMRGSAVELLRLGSQWVLLKGGHLEGMDESIDILAGRGSSSQFEARRVVTRNDHGTGCTLSAAIASLLPQASVSESVRQAKLYLTGALEASHLLSVGAGHGPLHHFHNHWPIARHPMGRDQDV